MKDKDKRTIKFKRNFEKNLDNGIINMLIGFLLIFQTILFFDGVDFWFYFNIVLAIFNFYFGLKGGKLI